MRGTVLTTADREAVSRDLAACRPTDQIADRLGRPRMTLGWMKHGRSSTSFPFAITTNRRTDRWKPPPERDQGALFRAAAGKPVSSMFVTVGAFSE